jgi:hypothetical protein
MKAELSRQLALVDWDFVLSDDRSAAGLHWYPGSFVPALPATLIEALSSLEDLVIDPYGGVGTTGIAAITRGRGAICCDINPVATLSSYVGICLVALQVEAPILYQAVFHELEALAGDANDKQSNLNLVPHSNLTAVDALVTSISDRAPAAVLKGLRIGPPQFDALTPWYERRTLAQLTNLMERIETSTSDFIRLAGFAMTSAVVRQLSSQTRSWGHIADNVKPPSYSQKEVGRAAANWLGRTYNRLNTVRPFNRLPKRRPFLYIRSVDWLDLNQDVDLISGLSQLLLTSPPYAGAIDYTLAQRLSLYILGRSEDEVKAMCEREMGARRKRFNSGHIGVWANELTSALDRQLEALGPTAHAAFVMPHKDFGRDVGEEALTGC